MKYYCIKQHDITDCGAACLAAGQVTLYQGNVDSISGTIAKYNEKLEKLNTVKQCIMTRNNTFDSNEGIYYSMVSSYLASYNYTSLQYDNQINEYQRQIDEYEKQIKKSKAEASKEDEPATGDETVSGNDIANENEANKAKETVAILTEKGNIAAEILTYEDKVKECETCLKSYDIQNDNCIVKANVSGYFYVSQELKTGSVIQTTVFFRHQNVGIFIIIKSIP